MKKEYIAPIMKVRKIQCSHMLCGSQDSMKINEDLGKDYENDAYPW